VEETRPEELADYDLIFIGTPVHGSRPAKKIEDFLDELPQLQGKKGAAFCTTHLWGDKTTIEIIKEKLLKKGIIFIDSFSCLGWSRLVGNFGPRIFNKGRPNEEDLRKAAEFAKRVGESVRCDSGLKSY
jgi:flavodoxin